MMGMMKVMKLRGIGSMIRATGMAALMRMMRMMKMVTTRTAMR